MSELYLKAKALFQEAMERSPSERASFLAQACGADAALRREVESWIAASDRAGSEFMASPAAKMCLTCDGTFGHETKFCPHCGQVLQDDPRALVGTRLDNLYQIEALLGQGGMGAVYRARHALLGDRVAIKTLKREFGDNPTFLKRFQREGRAARVFHHPNAVVVHDLRTTPAGLIYMVLEYIEGSNVRTMLRGAERFSPAEAVALLGPIASVLDAAHRSGVVHRDMKPENVMVGRDEHGNPIVKVLDLGIAKVSVVDGDHPSTELTVAGQILGTPHYMSPEQWGGGDVDGRADVYSLGVMAFELVTGTFPFAAKSIDEHREAHLTAAIPMAHEAYDDVPERFGLAIARALAKDRDDRWSTAGDFVAALAAAVSADGNATLPHDALSTVLTGEPAAIPLPVVDDATTIDSVPSGSPELPPPDGKGRSALWVAVAALVALAVGMAAYWARPGGQVVPPAAVEVPPVVAPPPLAVFDALRYEIEVKQKSDSGDVVRISGRDPIGRGREYRFVFTPAVRGRLAVIGPNTRNVPTLFLPVAVGGLIEPETSYTFPGGTWFTPIGDTPSDTMTLVFIPEGAVTPAFADGKAGRQLTVDEQRELASFLAANRVAPRYGDAASVALAAAEAGRPLAVELTIQY